MSEHRKLLLTILLYTFGCGPVTEPPHIVGTTSARPKLAVISILGPELEGKYVGLTAFNNRHFLANAAAWPINETATSAAEAAAHGSSRFDMVRVQYDRAALWAQVPKKPAFLSKYGADNSLDALRPSLAALAQTPSSPDLFLLLVPGRTGSKCPEGEACIGYGSTGYGIWVRSLLGMSRSLAYISVRPILVNARTVEEIGHRKMNEDTSLEGLEWKDDLSQFSMVEQEKIRSAILTLLTTKLPSTVSSLLQSAP